MNKPSDVAANTGAVRWEYLVLVCLVAWPFVASHYATGLVTETLIFAIVAMSLDLLMGYGGLVSFGHAAFFGLGAYATVLLSVKIDFSPWLGVIAGVAFAALGSGVIGYFCVRMSGVTFFMLTLAFSQLLYSGAIKWRWLTGGSDGVGGMRRPEVFGLALTQPVVMYFFALASVVVCLYLLRRIIASQFGHALVGLRENETRMRSMGYPTRALKLLAFVIAGTFAGVGGALYAIFNGFVSPDALSWGMSGMFLLMVVLGGAGSLLGPAIGAAAFLLMKNFISSQTDHWLLIVGIIFVACVMFFRGGIYGLIDRMGARWARP
jgi:branched-chain amino acid transport system permease protein